jgi:2-polyprenyl-3-methyl-5-hydroxy-6-metoxy-1,4-benzoquinol methylase
MAAPIAHFDNLYRANPDPWDYQSSPYEAQKYTSTLAALTRPHYGTIIEPGCSIGVLSARLAKRCDRFFALDFSTRAVDQAKKRLRPFAHATATVAQLPQDWPLGQYDLIILSELIYYLTTPEIEQLAQYVARDAVAGAECVMVHFQGETQTAITPDDARDVFCTTLQSQRIFSVVDHPSDGQYNHRTLLFEGQD